MDNPTLEQPNPPRNPQAEDAPSSEVATFPEIEGAAQATPTPRAERKSAPSTGGLFARVRSFFAGDGASPTYERLYSSEEIVEFCQQRTVEVFSRGPLKLQEHEKADLLETFDQLSETPKLTLTELSEMLSVPEALGDMGLGHNQDATPLKKLIKEFVARKLPPRARLFVFIGAVIYQDLQKARTIQDARTLHRTGSFGPLRVATQTPDTGTPDFDL